MYLSYEFIPEEDSIGIFYRVPEGKSIQEVIKELEAEPPIILPKGEPVFVYLIREPDLNFAEWKKFTKRYLKHLIGQVYNAVRRYFRKDNRT